MRVLIIFFISLFLFSCAPGGPVNPSDAFHSFRNAVTGGDASAAMNLLSSASIAKIKVMCSEFSKMDDKRRRAAAVSIGAAENALDALTPEKYVDLFIIKNPSGTSAGGAFKNKIKSVEKKGGSAAVILDNGLSLPFVKEGPYWKFDLASL